MALIDPELPKEYDDGQILTEAMLEAVRLAAEEAFATVNLNLTQIKRDCFVSSYDYTNNGTAALSTPLQTLISNLTTGLAPISGTISSTFTINSGGAFLTLSSSGLTAGRSFTFPDLTGVVATLDATQTFTLKTLTAPILSGTVTGTYLINSTTTGLEFAKFISTDATATTADFTIYRNSASPANSDVISRLNFSGNDNAVSEVTYGAITVTALDVTAKTSEMKFDVRTGASPVTKLTLGQSVATFTTALSVTGTGTAISSTTTGLEYTKFISTDATASGAEFTIYRNSASPANNDVVSYLVFSGNNSAVSEVTYGLITVTALDVTAQTSEMSFGVRLGGSPVTKLTLGQSVATFTTPILLPAADPPVANTANRNGIVRAWLRYVDGSGSVSNSYNIDSLASDDGDGAYDITLDTDFSGTSNNVDIASASGNGDQWANTGATSASVRRVFIYDVSSVGQVDDDFTYMAIGEQV